MACHVSIHRCGGVKAINNWLTVPLETSTREVGQALAEAWAAPA